MFESRYQIDKIIYDFFIQFQYNEGWFGSKELQVLSLANKIRYYPPDLKQDSSKIGVTAVARAIDYINKKLLSERHRKELSEDETKMLHLISQEAIRLAKDLVAQKDCYCVIL